MSLLITFLLQLTHWTVIHVQCIFSSKSENFDYLGSQASIIQTLAEQNISSDIEIIFVLEFTLLPTAGDVKSDKINRFTRFVLDFSAEFQTETNLQWLASEMQFVHIVMSSNTFNQASYWSLPGQVHPQYVAGKARRVIEWLNLSQASLSIPADILGTLFQNQITADNSGLVKLFVSLSNSYENIVGQVAKILKPSGMTWAVIYGNGEEIEWFLRAHEEKHIAGKGRAFLIIGNRFTSSNNSEPVDGIINSGGLYIIENGMESAKSSEEIVKFRLVNTLKQIANAYMSWGIHDSTFADQPPLCLKEQFKSQNYDMTERLIPSFGLYNTQKGALIKICDIGDTFESLDNYAIVYPGNISTKPLDITPQIEFVYLGGHLNNPMPIDSLAEAIHIGGQFAYKEIQSSQKLLPNYEIKMNQIEIGGSIFKKDAIGKFELQSAKLGHAYVGGFSYSFAKSFHDLEKQNPDIMKPKLYSNLFDSEFSDSENHPFLNRLSISNQRKAEILRRTMLLFNWTKAIYITSNMTESIDFNTQINSPRFAPIDIVLTEFIPLSANATTFASDYADLIDTIIDTKVRIIITLYQNQEMNFKLFETLYKRGHSPGDFIPFYDGYFNDISTLKEKYPDNFENAMKFFHGAVSFSSPGYFVGEIGAKLEIQNQETQGYEQSAIEGGWLEYDAMYTLAYAFDNALALGIAYEISDIFNIEIRSQRFTGCSGLISFQKGNNDRTDPIFKVYQTEYSNKQIKNIQFVQLDPLVGYVQLNATFFWADGSTGKPSDTFIEDWECPFSDNDIQPSPTGQIITSSICGFVLLSSIIITVWIWRRFWRVQILPLKESKEFSQPDILLFVGMIIEFFQYLGEGPDFSEYTTFISLLGTTAAADIEEIIDLKDGIFWIVVKACIAATCMMMVLYIFKVTNLQQKYPNNYFFKVFGNITGSLLPILGDILFLPIVQIFLEVFVCIETHGNETQDAFLYQDWYVNCWTGQHLTYCIFCGIWIAFYIPVAVYMRPTWQEHEHDLNIISSPLYLMVKSIFQILIVSLNKTLGRIEPEPFGFIYISFFWVYFIFLFKIKPYNYNRFCMWESILIAGVIWITSLTVVYRYLGDTAENQYFVLVLIIGWAILILAGLVLQRKYRDTTLPQLLHFPKNFDYALLIRFQLSSSETSANLLTNIVNLKTRTGRKRSSKGLSGVPIFSTRNIQAACRMSQVSGAYQGENTSLVREFSNIADNSSDKSFHCQVQPQLEDNYDTIIRNNPNSPAKTPENESREDIEINANFDNENSECNSSLRLLPIDLRRIKAESNSPNSSLRVESDLDNLKVFP